ncbi:MAG TPA: UDP-N-acetylmuramoyl-L-alanyl-D-glutamate--2,6-diaminopimelate ligase [Firmicutes bacterium]|nr:UDP-N-acetylmuramoyl-L-alanyl-D-glutamate--2,6-diaminopimelate ligase [Bacillota bacterium]
MVQISQLIANLECELIGADREISGLSYDSRKIKPGELFFAIRGFKTDGHNYVKDAIANGAVTVVVEQIQNVDPDITQILVSDTRAAMGKMAAAYFNYPSRRLRVIGVTGTNGKTTTTYLIKSILEQAGYGVGLIGTIQILIGNKAVPARRTTPESLDLQAILAEMIAHNLDYAVMEVSSHALELNRTAGLEFDTAVFTNLTQDHLDFHQCFEHYFQAKAKLFAGLMQEPAKDGKVSIINVDDPYGLKVAGCSTAPVYSYGIEQPAQVSANDVRVSSKGVQYRLHTPFGDVDLDLNLTGLFNVYNTLAACTACLAAGVGLSDLKAGLEKVTGVPGRFELVDMGQDFAVIVDYAHTPDSLANVLRTARSFADNRVIAVFGAGGDRDRAKRPLMGKVAAELSDYVILTADNPRSEDPVRICHEIEQGMLPVLAQKTSLKYVIEPSRSKAIEKAIRMAKAGDVVVFAGKGHETYQEFKDHTIDFDDRAEARRILKEL